MKIRLVFLSTLSLVLLTSCNSVELFVEKDTVENLNRKKLKDIPTEVFEKKELKVLRLYGNQLDSISYRIGELQNLEELYIGKNNLKNLPKEIGQLKKLKILSVQYNEITDLPAEIGEMESLEQLILNQNELRMLPTEISQLQKLEMLQLKMNWLDSLPTSIGECKQLKFIYLNRNNLTRIPESIGQITGLREIYLAGAGQLVQIPESFCNLRMLEVLEVDQHSVIPTCLLVRQTSRLSIIRK